MAVAWWWLRRDNEETVTFTIKTAPGGTKLGTANQFWA